jgi:regulator of RNase E activity RraA
MSLYSSGFWEKLRGIDTPTVCNVIELFEVRPRNQGYMGARIQPCFPELAPMVGVATTATFRASGPPIRGGAHSSILQQVERFAELDGPPIVVFQDLDSPCVAATFGEQMCRTYQAFGAVGLITSGAGRDLDQVRSLRFPVFTTGTICAHGYCHVLDTHVPVHVGDVVVYPNDLLHGDANGVTTIPREIAAEVADAAKEFIAAEAGFVRALSVNSATLDLLAAAMREKEDTISRLRARVSRSNRGS